MGLLLLLIVALVLTALVLAVIAHRRRPDAAPRDDLLRAGARDGVGAAEAALRAGGTGAWMRPAGFGG